MKLRHLIPHRTVRVRRGGFRPDDAERHHRRRPEHGRLRQQLSRAEIRGHEPRREGARGGNGPRRRGIAEDLREALGAAEGRQQRVGRRRRSHSPARVGHHGQRKAAHAVPRRHRRRQARVAGHRQECARRQRRRLRAADVPQPDRVRLQPGPGEGAAEVVRRVERVGQEESEAVRLQRRQGRHVGRRLRHRLGVGVQRPRRQAGEGPLRRHPRRRRSTRPWAVSRNSTSTS